MGSFRVDGLGSLSAQGARNSLLSGVWSSPSPLWFIAVPVANGHGEKERPRPGSSRKAHEQEILERLSHLI